ncbi:MAG TPA: beta-propeller fold lactonase family protein [Candidatus Sulfotelmatobacter sp.]|jgi:6-phosphogluconolactonase (cycloisomerase 2 family)
MSQTVRACLGLSSVLLLAASAFATTPVVTVTSPANNSTVSAPTHFVATATSSGCSKGISAIRIYSAPGVSAYTVSGGKLNGYISLANGTYNTVVQAWDNCGGVAKANVTITVNAQSAPAGFFYLTMSNWVPNGANNINNVIGYTIVAGGDGALAQTLQGPVNTNIFPIGAATDKGGYRLYVADWDSGDVFAYYIYGNDGYIYPVPGSPFPVGRSVQAVAVSPSGDYVFAARSENAPGDGIEVFQVQSNGSLVQAPGSPYATQNGPYAMVVDPSGKFLYVGDTSNYIEAFAISSSGYLTPLAGSPYPMPLPKNGCGVNPNDTIDWAGKYLYTADRGDNSISGYDINSSSGVPTAISGSPWSAEGGCIGGINQSNFNPDSLAIDGTGKFMYAHNGDSFSISIFSINQSTGALTWIKDTANTSAGALGPIRTDPTGNYLYTSSFQGGIDVYVINHTTGDLTASPSSPIPIPPDGNAYWTSFAVAPPQ